VSERPVLVETPESVSAMARALEGAERLYLDTEFESNRSGIRLCLLQATDGKQVFLVDALKARDLSPLRGTFETSEWVVHAGLQDVDLIRQAIGASSPRSLFDTQVGWALSTAESNVSLAYLKFLMLGVREDKAHQADDWTRRPLSEDQLRYAASDILHLPALFEALEKRAQTLSPSRPEMIRLASREATERLTSLPHRLTLESFRNAWQLGPAAQNGLRFLIEWFNGLSREEREDAPEPKALFAIASRMPHSRDVLLQLKGVPRGFALRHHKRIIEGLADAAHTANTRDFVAIAPPPYATFEDIRLDAWLALLRAEVCAELRVSPEFVLPARVTKNMRELLAELRGVPVGRPDALTAALAPALEGFRKALLLEKIQAFCEKEPPPL
jgi:ribonuclease D